MEEKIKELIERYKKAKESNIPCFTEQAIGFCQGQEQTLESVIEDLENLILGKSKKEWTIQISQNSWEYIGEVIIKAHELEKVEYDTICADGVLIKFDEGIGDIYVHGRKI